MPARCLPAPARNSWGGGEHRTQRFLLADDPLRACLNRANSCLDLDGELQLDLIGAQLVAESPESPYGLCRTPACQVETVGVGVAGDLDDALGNAWWL
ncbi:hypothetical protein ACFWP7_19515 [Streptomyces sp. NPDC058470]|uniref:hypothetical protein n=1 Tax=Streptomyces sp. NPDC058470 TaxID=3346515 RepID=UPI003666B90C